MDSEADDELFEHHRLRADPRQSLVRLDKFLSDRLANASRNKIQDAIARRYVEVNGTAVKPNYKVKPGDEVVVMLPQPPRDNEVVPENLPLDIRWEDDDLLVVHKAAGMVVHPAYQNWTGTLVNALAHHFQQLPTGPSGTGRPGLVHRIDKDTSGLMVIAKNESAMTHLARQFFDHTIERTYWALVWGEPDPPDGTIDVNLGRSLKDRRVTDAFPAGDIGRHAVTHYQTLRPLRYVSLVRCNLETGRTHQIRAHMRYRGHPLFNDATYGGDKIVKGTQFSKYRAFVQNCFKLLPRQALHAKSLGFIHPRTGEALHFDSDLPADFAAALDKWDRYVQHE
ncbi:MAG: RluA family pseudouridine synthase [Catalinimonas sp.]